MLVTEYGLRCGLETIEQTLELHDTRSFVRGNANLSVDEIALHAIQQWKNTIYVVTQMPAELIVEGVCGGA